MRGMTHSVLSLLSMGERKIMEHFVVLKTLRDPFWRLFTSQLAPGLLGLRETHISWGNEASHGWSRIWGYFSRSRRYPHDR
jgi:hypothetical protein